MTKGDKFTIDGKSYVCTWSSDEMTDQERYDSHLRTADFMEQYGLSGAFQRALAQQYAPTPDRSGEADETRSGSAEGESGLPEGSSNL